MSFQGTPCWFELGTSDLDAAGVFYASILGWTIVDSGMEGFDYRLGKSGDDMVAGMMSNSFQEGPPPPNWVIYFAADDCDMMAATVTAAGGKVLKQPEDIPGTGRYAIVVDPQGAVFGLLQPDMSKMSADERTRAENGGGAFNQQKAGHGNWVELMSSDPAAALGFYTQLFGWTKGDAMDMGETGTYQLFRHKGVDIGAIMPLIASPASAWMPYFGTDTPVSKLIDQITAAGGTVSHGPSEVPGPAWIAAAQDPQGAWFAVVGAEK